jgi:hypothetical protein
VPIDPVGIVVTGAREANHLPRDHVAVAAVDGIGEEAFLYVLDSVLEESLAVGAFEFDLSALDSFEQVVLRRVGELSKRLAVMLTAVAIQGCQAVAIDLGGSPLRLRSLVLSARHERRAVVKPFRATVGTGELAIEEDCAAGFLAAEGLRIGWNDAVG